MPPRIRLRVSSRLQIAMTYNDNICRCQYATATTTTPAPSPSQINPPPPIQRHPTQQPPSYRRPELRNSQLLRTYVSLLETSPVIIFFQHNNLLTSEWAAIRRELGKALMKVDEASLAQGEDPSQAIGNMVKIQVVKTRMLEHALRIVDFYRQPRLAQTHRPPPAPTPELNVPIPSEMIPGPSGEAGISHLLSREVYDAIAGTKGTHPLSPLLQGSIAVLTLPSIAPQYLKTALTYTAPSAPRFPAPKRRVNPGFWDPAVQDGLKKLMLLGARVEGRSLDTEGARWVGGLDGLDGLRAQLVGILQGAGQGLVGALEGAGRSLWFTVEGRRGMLEEEEKASSTSMEEKKDAEKTEEKADEKKE